MTNLRPVKIDYDTPISIKIVSELSRDKPSRMIVRMLDTGKLQCLIVDTVLRNRLIENFNVGSYVGKCFWVKKLRPRPGKDYAEFDLHVGELSSEHAEQIARWELADPIQAVDLMPKLERGWFPTRDEYEVLRSRPKDFKRWYLKYLQRKLWKATIKPRILRRDENRCHRCGGYASTVHHMSYDYEVILGERDDELIAICDGCHDFISIDDQRRKRTGAETDRLARQTKDIEACAMPKIDGRVRFPPQWKRMNAVQRDSYNKGWFLRKK